MHLFYKWDLPIWLKRYYTLMFEHLELDTSFALFDRIISHLVG